MGSIPPQNKGRPTSSGSIPFGGFTPGTILSERYRIVGLVYLKNVMPVSDV
jgi:hypothetical protein